MTRAFRRTGVARLPALLGAAALFAATSAAAAEITVVSFGGANGQALSQAYYQPFAEKSGVKVLGAEYNGEQARIKAMVDTGRVTWHVVDVELDVLGRGCESGLYEKLDWSKLGKKEDFLPEAVTECGAGAFVWSTALAYNADKLKTAPTGWKDFWDTEKFPGKRSMRKGARYNLEFALMADGVAPGDVYKVLEGPGGIDRAFAKLDTLKPHIQWWEAGAQPPQMLVAGDVVMSTAYNGRIDAARREGRNLNVVWDGSIYDLDYWVIPKGAPNQKEAYDFLAYALAAEPQQQYTKLIAYGPTNTKAMNGLDEKILADMPNSPQNAKTALSASAGSDFWIDHGEELEQRFAAWAAR